MDRLSNEQIIALYNECAKQTALAKSLVSLVGKLETDLDEFKSIGLSPQELTRLAEAKAIYDAYDGSKLEKADDYIEQLERDLTTLREANKGCDYCNDISKHKGFGYAEFFQQTAPDDMYEISIDVKFCPNCGRKLPEKE